LLGSGADELRQLGEVRRLLPNLTQSEERAWRKLFAAANVSAIDATYFVDQLIVDGQTARAHVVSDLSVTKDGKTDSKQRTEAVVLSCVLILVFNYFLGSVLP